MTPFGAVASLRGLARAGLLLSAMFGAAVTPSVLAAQVGDISNVTYPGWIPSDRVEPAHTVTATYDGTLSNWTYDYTLANGPAAQQEILEVRLRFNALVLDTAAPTNWEARVFGPTAKLPGLIFQGVPPEVIGSSPNGPALDQIPAGQSRSGFRIVSAYPPGYARTYTRGFAPVPYLPSDWESTDGTDGGVPADTTDSQRRYALGPTRYTQVVTGGNRRPGVDGFLGFMNLSTSGSTVIDPAPIALKFSLNGETVYRETFRATLNGVDVTSAFKPGPSDGADLVAVFRVGSSPLVAGKNVLLTSVERLKAGTTQRAADTDRITFTLNANASPTFTSNSLNNLPFPDPIRNRSAAADRRRASQGEVSRAARGLHQALVDIAPALGST